ncbi:hypothetical protein SCHPADRAFT_681027 [Schizopora paradoxa]|uniref:F-box domain-containing protein n=1 Tax=Schizopora paradoxa TaxID=27342 RepID=A0A0H2R5T5_9AGAM|nr:hypothetical protein SCHPADRAFT_681027 [Schizopora paradoxa]
MVTQPRLLLHRDGFIDNAYDRRSTSSPRHFKRILYSISLLKDFKNMGSDSADHSSDEAQYYDCDVSNVLLALEKAARMPGFYDVDLSEVYDMEYWSAYQKVYGGDKDPFEDNEGGRVVDATWANCLTKSTYEISRIKKMLQALLNVANDLEAEFKSSKERIVAAKRSKGIKSLPDDLLAKIFQIAVWEEDYDGAKQAIRLASVSRRFRTVALEKRGLWTTLFSLSSRNQLEALIPRAGPSEGFDVFIHYDFDKKERGAGLKPFIDVCRPILSRWKTLTLTQEYYEFLGPKRSSVEDALEELHNLFVNDGLHLSTLEELNVHGETSDRHKDGKSDICAWAANLRAVRCDYFLPSTTRLSSVSTLIVSQGISGGSSGSPLNVLLDFLRMVPNLSFFQLEANDASMEFVNETLPVVECAAIISFKLQLDNFFLLSFPVEDSCIAALMNALRLPSLEEFSVDVKASSSGRTEGECAEWSQRTGNLMCALLPDHISMSTRMKSMFFKLWRSGSVWGDEEKVSPDARTSHIPLDRILHFRTVALSSFVQVLFTQEAGDADPARISEGRLRELRFVECKNMTSAHLKGTVDSLESLGVWDDIERIVVKKCEQLVYNEIVEVVGEKRLQYISH